MSELFLAIGGVGIATLSAVYSTIIDKSKLTTERSILVIIAGIGFGLGFLGAVNQKKESDNARMARDKAQTALTDLQKRVGTLDGLDREIKARSEDLTKLNLLGGAKYYVVIGTYPDTRRGNDDFNRVLANFKSFFPDADKNGMIWKNPRPNGQYEMGFGRNLSPAAAEVYLRLAQYLAANQHPMMRLER